MRNSDVTLSDELYGVGRQVTGVYEPVVENLQQVRVLARAFDQGAETLEAADDSCADATPDDRTVTVNRSIAALCETIAEAARTIDTDDLSHQFRQLDRHCRQLEKRGRELSAMSSLMLMTAANASDAGSVRRLVGELRDLADQLRTECASMLEATARISRVRREAARSLMQAHDSTRSRFIDDAPGAQAVPQPAVSIGGGQGDLRRMSRSLSSAISKIMPRIVACMQHPDAFSQRCDHVAQLVRARDDDALPAAARATLAALGQAQVQDMRRELDSIQDDTSDALAEVAAACDQTIGAFREALRQDGRLAAMTARQDATRSTRSSIQAVKEEADAALRELETCHTVFDAFSRTFERLNQMRQKVRLSALNADLSERRSEKNTPEMRAVTKAVGDCAHDCGETITALTAAFERIRAAFAKAARDRLEADLDTVCGHLDAAGAELDALTAAVQARRETQERCAGMLEDLVANAREAGSRIAANSLSLKMLEQIETALAERAEPGKADPGAVDPSVLQAIYERYSIEREREVHRHLLGAAEPATPDASAAVESPDEDDDPLASVLF